MKNIKIEVTPQELSLLTSLMADQLFRREFIDPKMPGYRGDPAELASGKDLVRRLKALVQPVLGSSPRHAPSHLSASPNSIPHAV